MENVTFLAAFFGGVLSFLSPCVFPLIPVYLSFITGISVADLKMQISLMERLKKVVIPSIFFVIGFSIVFVLMGAGASFIGQFLQEKKWWLEKIAGVIIIIFGLHFLHILRIPILDIERRMGTEIKRGGNLLSALILGFAFGFGWTPCIGPILASILALATTQESVLKGMLLLSVYSLSLGIPFILSGVLVNFFLLSLKRFSKVLFWVEIIAGIFLVILGGLLLFGILQQLATYLPNLNLG